MIYPLLTYVCKIPHETVEEWDIFLRKTCCEYDINNPYKIACFLSTIVVESNNLNDIVENLNYSTDGLLKTFPNRINKSDAIKYGRNDDHISDKRAIANIVYNGRMGNKLNSDDGWKYRGRGLIQITGFDNYKYIGESLGLDLINNPDLLMTKEYASLSAGCFMKLNKCFDEENYISIDRVSGIVNCGNPNVDASKINGLFLRRKLYSQILEVIENERIHI